MSNFWPTYNSCPPDLVISLLIKSIIIVTLISIHPILAKSKSLANDYNAIFYRRHKTWDSLETKINSYSGEDVSALCDLLDEREQKQWQYQSLREIASEPDIYNPYYDNFYADAFKNYIIRSFAPVFEDAIPLKTERGRKNRYLKLFDRFKDCYDRLPESASKELDNLMSEYDIRFSPDGTHLKEEATNNV